MKTTQKEVPHAKTPWKVEVCYKTGMGLIKDASGNDVCIVDDGKGHHNAAYIVKTVNSHEALLKAAKHFQEKYESVMHSEFDYTEKNGGEWSFKRDRDEESIGHAKTISLSEGE